MYLKFLSIFNWIQKRKWFFAILAWPTNFDSGLGPAHKPIFGLGLWPDRAEKFWPTSLEPKKLISYSHVITLLKIEAIDGFWTLPRLMMTIIGTIVSYWDINFVHANFWRIIMNWANIVGAFATVAGHGNLRNTSKRTYLIFMTKISKNWNCLTIFTNHFLII